MGTEADGVCWLQVVVRRGVVVGLQCVRVRGGVVTWGGLGGWWMVVVAAGRVVLAVHVLPHCPLPLYPSLSRAAQPPWS